MEEKRRRAGRGLTSEPRWEGWRAWGLREQLTGLFQFKETGIGAWRQSWCTPLRGLRADGGFCCHLHPLCPLCWAPVVSPWHAPPALRLEALPTTSSSRAPSLTSLKVLAAEAGWVFTEPCPLLLSTQPDCSLPVSELSPGQLRVGW